MDSTEPPKADKKACRLCASEIDSSALICTFCGKYQSPWRNQALFFASGISLVSFLAATLSFTWREVAEITATSNVDLISYSSVKGAVYFNSGRRDAMIFYVKLVDEETYMSEVTDIYSKDPAGSPLELKSRTTPQGPVELIDSPTKDQILSASTGGQDYFPVYFFSGDPDVDHIMSDDQRHRKTTFIPSRSCKIKVYFSDLGSSIRQGIQHNDYDCRVAIAKSARMNEPAALPPREK